MPAILPALERAILGAQWLRTPISTLRRGAAMPQPDGSLRIVALGDIALLPSGKPEAGGWASLFSPLFPFLRSADLTVANLESVLTSRTTPAGSIGSFLRAEPEAVNALTQAGIGVVTCANNHCLDFGPEALCESLSVLGEPGIESCGVVTSATEVAEPAIVERNGATVAVLGFCDDYFIDPAADSGLRPAEFTDDHVRAAVEAASKKADIVIVNLHCGYEWALHPMLEQRDRARAVAAAGASIVLCHHAHVPMAIEMYGDAVIAHGLGNCAFPWRERVTHPWRNTSYALAIDIEGNRVRGATAVPTHIGSNNRIGLSTGRSRRVMLGGLARLGERLQDDKWLHRVEQSRLSREAFSTFNSILDALERSDRSFVERCAWLRSPRQRRLRAFIRQLGNETSSLAAQLDHLASTELSDTELRREGRALEHPTMKRAIARLVESAPVSVRFLERIP